MSSRYRFALRPQWWGLHALAIALVVTMVALGRWQMIVSEHKHFNIRNFGYALQWWVFSLFVVVMWLRILRDHARRQAGEVPGATVAAPAEDPVAYRRYVPPAAAASEDPVLADYNAYLARLNREGTT